MTTGVLQGSPDFHRKIFSAVSILMRYFQEGEVSILILAALGEGFLTVFSRVVIEALRVERIYESSLSYPFKRSSPEEMKRSV